MNKPLGVALIGCGGIALANHVPGLKLCPDTRLVALCDSNPEVLARAAEMTGVTATFSDYREMLALQEVDAVIVATPNFIHAPAVKAAAAHGKHVLCEKPLAMNLAEGIDMLEQVRDAGVRHMTAFTYRFVPAMRYMAHLVKSGHIGTPYHFRTRRQQDWGTRNLGWRQIQSLAATGEIGDMLSHRIDFAHYLVGEIDELVADTRRFHDEREGVPSDLEDWVSLIARFKCDATVNLESTKVASGHGEGGNSQDYCEITGSEGSIVCNLQENPNELLIGKRGGGGLKPESVPREFLTVPGTPRNPDEGNPGQVFRYDQDFEFVQAIRENRECCPSFVEGIKTQAVMEAILLSVERRAWVKVDYPVE